MNKSQSKNNIVEYKTEITGLEFKPFLSGGNKPQQRCFERAGDDKFLCRSPTTNRKR